MNVSLKCPNPHTYAEYRCSYLSSLINVGALEQAGAVNILITEVLCIT